MNYADDASYRNYFYVYLRSLTIFHHVRLLATVLDCLSRLRSFW